MSDIKAFGKWNTDDIEFSDRGMERYINTEPVLAPKGKGPAKDRFREDVPVVERLINKIMRGGRNTGKKANAFRIVEDALDIVHERTDENPLQLLVRAVENAGPREEAVRLKYGGIAVQKPVDTSPQRRVNVAVKLLAEAVHGGSHKTARSAEEVLADEIVKASNYDMESYAVGRKEETERVAAAAR